MMLLFISSYCGEFSKVKNFQRNYLESEKFFSKFSPKPKSENFQGKVT